MAASRTSFRKGATPGPGRPKGSRDRVPRGSVKAAFETFLAEHGGQRALVDAIAAGIKDRRRALGFLALAAKVLDEAKADVPDGPTRIVVRWADE